MNTQTPHALTGCLIAVENEVFGTRKVVYSPQSVEEAMQSHGDVVTADEWIRWHGLTDGGSYEDPQPVAACIFKSKGEIKVLWHIVGDAEAARLAMTEIMDGSWRASL